MWSNSLPSNRHLKAFVRAVNTKPRLMECLFWVCYSLLEQQFSLDDVEICKTTRFCTVGLLKQLTWREIMLIEGEGEAERGERCWASHQYSSALAMHLGNNFSALERWCNHWSHWWSQGSSALLGQDLLSFLH